VVSFKKDLFISYAHIDNQPLTPEHEGWISRFHASLNALLSMRLGKQARIWRDDKLQGNDVFAEEIVAQFGHTAVLVSVLTPRYLQSEWCTREVSEFCAHAEASGGVVIDRRARVFKVLKTPVDNEEPLPPIMRDLLGYDFYAIEDGTPLELDAAYGEKFAQDYNRKVTKLAFEIAQLLQALDAVDGSVADTAVSASSTLHSTAAPAAGSAAGSPAESAAASPSEDNAGDAVVDGLASVVDTGDPSRTVYLAECSFDLKEARETLQTELSRLGYDVLPDRQLPREEEDYVASVAGLMSRCGLSVHLVGKHIGAVADGPRHASVVLLQNEIAAQRSGTHGLRRVIWQPADLAGETPEQQTFIKALHEDASTQAGADLVVDGIESLRRAVLSALVALEPAPDDPLDAIGSDASGEQVPSVHIVCTSQDRKATIPLRKYLKAQAFDVTLPAFEGDAAEVRAANTRLLSRCDVVIVFYGQGEEAWKRTVDTELKKLLIHRGDKGLPPIHTVLSTPPSEDKEDLVDMDEANLINLLEASSEENLETLLQDVVAAAGTEVEPA